VSWRRAEGEPRRTPWRWLRVRVPLTAMAVFAVSLAAAAILAYELLLQDGRSDIEIVLAREHERFERSIAALLTETREDDPTADDLTALEEAVRRYLELNPSTASYWTIVTFQDGLRLAASNGPPELEPLFTDRTLPAGRLNTREVIDTGTEAGEILTSSVPILLGGEQLATLQIVAPMAPVRSGAREAAYLLAAAAGASLLVGGVLLAATLWRSLQPLGALAAAARSTDLRRLDARVEEPDSGDEVALLAAEFNRMLDRLESATSQQQEFLASVGHELRTPITIARGNLELLTTVDRDDPEAVAATVAIVGDELGRMGRLVEDLMTIARVRTPDFVRPRQLDLVSWFEELELKLRATADGQRVSIVPPPPVTLYADPDRLTQAVLNLTTNAAVHNPPGTPIRIHATLDPEHDHLLLVVEDEGHGIDPAIIDEVFAPFVRAGDARDSTGLGLAVVHAVVTAHGGRIGVRSDRTGTAITLALPWLPDEADEDGTTAGTAPSLSTSSTAPSGTEPPSTEPPSTAPPPGTEPPGTEPPGTEPPRPAPPSGTAEVERGTGVLPAAERTGHPDRDRRRR
jgi:two-component system, OmpR family, sensor kinase